MLGAGTEELGRRTRLSGHGTLTRVHIFRQQYPEQAQGAGEDPEEGAILQAMAHARSSVPRPCGVFAACGR